MQKLGKDLQARGWCLTINNPSGADKKQLELLSNSDVVLYLSAQLEVGRLRTEHIQAYIEWCSPRLFSQVKSMFPTAHIEKRRGTPFEAFEYCLKNESRSECYWSVCSQTVPKRSFSKQLDWYELCRQIPTLYEFKKRYEYLYIKNQKYVQTYYLDFSRVPVKRDLEVIVLFGDTGIGKTSYVYENENPEDVYVKDTSMWWDGYVGQPVVLIDEYAGQFSIEYLLKVLQGFPMQLQVKGGYVPAFYTKVYILSNFEYNEWYGTIGVTQLLALRRRITRFVTRCTYEHDWCEKKN